MEKITIVAGSGGEEPKDFANILLGMYVKHCAAKGWTHSVEESGEGVRLNVDCEPENFKEEKGVHRLVRVSPYDKEKRRVTSFVAVLVGDSDRGNINWGYQVRTYVLNPYLLAKNHKTGKETDKVYEVLEGNLDLLK